MRNDELGNRRPVDDQAQPPAIFIADRVQHESFSRVKAQSETPVLPPHLPPVDLEAHTRWLADLDAGQAQRVAGQPVAVFLRTSRAEIVGRGLH